MDFLYFQKNPLKTASVGWLLLKIVSKYIIFVFLGKLTADERKADERKILRHFFQCLFQEDVNEIIPVIPYFYSIQARFSASNILRDVTESKMMQDTPDATNEL